MLANRQGKQLWIADETGGYVQVKKPADIHNRPRGRGLPDWWVEEKTPDWRPPRSSFEEEKAPAKRLPDWVLVDGAQLPEQDAARGAGPGMKIGAGGKPQGYDSHGRYTGPRGGAASLRHGSVSTFGTEGRMYADAGKQAGADSETGRREPKSLLSATAEELDKMAVGTSQAVTQGAAGAKQALSRTWQELSTNEELHKGVEFGVKAAGEVSKDVWAKAGEDAAMAYATGLKALRMGDTAGHVARSAGKGLFVNGAKDALEWPGKARDIGARVEELKKRTYQK